MKPEISLRTLKAMGYYVGIGVIEPFSPLRARGITADSSEKEKRRLLPDDEQGRTEKNYLKEY